MGVFSMRSKWFKWASVLLMATLVLAGCGAGNDQGADETPPATEDNGDNGDTAENGGTTDLAAGETIYQESTCITCHGGNMEGGNGPSLQKVGATYSKDEIIDIIDNGKGTMPPQGNTLDDADKETLAAWLAEQK